MNNNKQRPKRASSGSYAPKTKLTEMEEEIKAGALDRAVQMMMKIRAENGGSMPDSTMKDIVQPLRSVKGLENADRHTVANWLKKQKRLQKKNNNKEQPSEVAAATSDSTPAAASNVTPPPPQRDKGGRPKGSSEVKKRQAVKDKLAATEWAAKTMIDLKNKAGKKKLVNGALDRIVNEANQRWNLAEDNDVNGHTVETRMKRNKPLGRERSPLEDVKPVLVATCLQLARIGWPLDEDQFLEFVAGTIKDTEHEEKYKKWRKVHRHPEGEIGEKYYCAFLKRHEDELNAVRCHAKDTNRTTWGAHKNIDNMCQLIYDKLVESGIAEKLDQPVWMDAQGNIVDKEQASGMMVEIILKCPERFLFCDETGCNTNMKVDGQVGGKRRVAGKGNSKATMVAAMTDIRFTVPPITNGLGEAVCCVVIFKSDDPEGIPANWMTGVDVSKIPEGISLESINSGEFVCDNVADGKMCGGGPTCVVNGKQVPCLARASPHGGITSEMLAEALQHLDVLEVFPREDEDMASNQTLSSC